MNTNKQFLLTFFILLTLCNCTNSRLYSNKTYDDKVISVSEKINGVYTRKFIRHEWLYIDKTDGKKIIERNIYVENKLLYKYPIDKPSLPKIDLRLLSGNNFIKAGVVDTLLIAKKGLPPMNRSIVAIGGAAIGPLSDSTYFITVLHRLDLKTTIRVIIMDEFEEINGRKIFIDSLIIPIK